MIAQPHQAAAAATFPATSAASSAASGVIPPVSGQRPLRALLSAVAMVAGLAVSPAPLQHAHAQASVPAAEPATAPLAGAAGEGRDFEAERKAIRDSRAWTNYRFAVAERACYSKFFVTDCIDDAKEIQRGELATLRKRELEVGDAERAYRAETRDREQAIRRAEYEASQPTRTAEEQANREAFQRKQQEQQLRDAQRQADAPRRAANAAAYDQKQADFDARMRQAQEQGAQQARQREENAREFEAKQREAEERRKALEERKAKAQEKNQGSASSPRPFGF
jgi:hypothetical protein